MNINPNGKWGWNNVDAIYKKQLDLEYSYNFHMFNSILHILSETFNSLIIRSSIQGVLNYVSPNSFYILGYEWEEMLGKKITFFLHEKDRQRLLDMDNQDSLFLENERSYTVRLKKRDGLFIWSELEIHILRDIRQNPREILYIIKEKPISDEDNLLKNDKMALIGQLAAGIAHEIRNPLTSIKGFIQLMKSEPIKNDQYLEIIDQEIDRISSITNELMIFAKPNHLNYEHQDLKMILRSCITLLEGVAYQKQIQIVLDSCEEPVYVFCDKQKIKQVIINLIKNALESMEDPGIITICMRKHEGQGVLSITDEGCGIPNELVGKLGQPFFTTKSNGNGLGLMMCYKIMEEHEGRIEVESELGIGTTFYVFLPLEDS